MTTKRVIFEQEDGGDIQSTNNIPVRTNFDSFSDGLVRGGSFKGIGCTALILIGIVLLLCIM